MSELFDRDECIAYFRGEVLKAGGAKKWLRKNKVSGLDHVLHMIDSGSYFEHPQVMARLGFRSVDRWESIAPVSPSPPR